MFLQETPKTAKKRQINSMETNEEETSGKKQKEDQTVLSTLKAFMAEIRDEKKRSEKRVGLMETNIALLKESDIKTKQKLSKMDSSKINDNVYTANVMEDLDGIDNKNLKNTVIVKKLKAASRYQM